MKLFPVLRQLFLLILGAVFVAGCTSVSPSVSFYTLTPLADQKVTQADKQESSTLVIRVMPVELPHYLDRPEIMTRENQNSMNLAQFHRWAEPLGDNITRVLAENLGLLLGSDQVFVNPLVGIDEDAMVALKVLRLEADPGDQVLLKAQWTVSPGRAAGNAATEVSTFSEPLQDEDYESLAAAISKSIGLVSREIAEKITELPKD